MSPSIVNFIAWVLWAECVLGLVVAGGGVWYLLAARRERRRRAKALVFDPIRSPRWWRAKS